MSVPNVASYRAMEPVASHWQQHNALGESLVAGLKNAGVKIFSGGSMEMAMTQTSYSLSLIHISSPALRWKIWNSKRLITGMS